MTDAAAKLRQFHSTTPVWAKEDRAVLLASADTIEAQAERIRVLREALEKIAQFDSYEPAGPAANTARAAVPPGYALVPIEPTHGMLSALTQEWHPSKHGPMKQRYRAMIAAAGDKI